MSPKPSGLKNKDEPVPLHHGALDEILDGEDAGNFDAHHDNAVDSIGLEKYKFMKISEHDKEILLREAMITEAMAREEEPLP